MESISSVCWRYRNLNLSIKIFIQNEATSLSLVKGKNMVWTLHMYIVYCYMEL